MKGREREKIQCRDAEAQTFLALGKGQRKHGSLPCSHGYLAHESELHGVNITPVAIQWQGHLEAGDVLWAGETHKDRSGIRQCLRRDPSESLSYPGVGQLPWGGAATCR